MQKIQVRKVRVPGHFRAHLCDPTECSNTFVPRLNVLLPIDLSPRSVVLRLMLEHYALAHQMRVIERDLNAIGGCLGPSRSHTNCLQALPILIALRAKICAMTRGERDA